MKRKTHLFQGIVVLLLFFLITPFACAYPDVHSARTANVTPGLQGFDVSLEKIITNTTVCPHYSFSAGGLICRSNEGIVGVYDRKGKKIFSARDFQKESAIPSKDTSLTRYREKQYGSILNERAINGQFDQVTETYEQYIWNMEHGIYEPPMPDGWSFIGENGPQMYWEPDDWSSEEQSDVHATVYFSHFGERDAIQTNVDATGGQYIRIAVGPKGPHPLEVYLDEILLGSVTEPFSISQFDISNQSWTTTSYLKVVAAGGSMDSGSGSLLRNISLMANSPFNALIADFTATPTTGTFPLNVTFTDNSTGLPTSWNWSFGDGGTSSLQNPSNTYTTAGTYTVNLTATNAAGSNSTVKQNLVTVSAPQTTYTVFAEGISDYHGGQPPLGSAVPMAQTFYQNIAGSDNGGITWSGYGAYYNDDAGSKHWSASEVSTVKADNADFALFAGHGANDRIYFGTNNSVPELLRTDIQYGGSKVKWVTLSACNILDENTKDNWKPVFNGLHILNSYETEGLLYDRQGGIYAARLKGGMFEGDSYLVRNIRDAWRMTLEDTIVSTEYYGASMWAEPCGGDFLPGYGSFCSAPVKENGNYNISYKKFDCDSETSD